MAKKKFKRKAVTREEKYAQKAYDLMAEIERDEESNPLTCDGVIRSIILKNPEMVQYRDSALCTMYCLLGSGVGWRDGRIGDASPNNYINMPPAAGGQGCWSRDFGRDDSLKRIFANASEELKEYKQELEVEEAIRMKGIYDTIDTIDERVQQYNPHPMSWYPISWYACNLCAPDNAQEDFFNAAIETLHLILDASYEVCTKRWIDFNRTKPYAEQILKALMKSHRKKASETH